MLHKKALADAERRYNAYILPPDLKRTLFAVGDARKNIEQADRRNAQYRCKHRYPRKRKRKIINKQILYQIRRSQ